jgi:hypothetical protein
MTYVFMCFYGLISNPDSGMSYSLVNPSVGVFFTHTPKKKILKKKKKKKLNRVGSD